MVSKKNNEWTSCEDYHFSTPEPYQTATLFQPNPCSTRSYPEDSHHTILRCIDKVFQGLGFCYAYIDDILIAFTLEEVHLDHLAQLIRCLMNYGIIVNPGKCTFGVT